MGEPLNRLDDASRTSADENQGLEQEHCEEKPGKYLGIPRSLRRPFTSVGRPEDLEGEELTYTG